MSAVNLHGGQLPPILSGVAAAAADAIDVAQVFTVEQIIMNFSQEQIRNLSEQNLAGVPDFIGDHFGDIHQQIRSFRGEIPPDMQSRWIALAGNPFIRDQHPETARTILTLSRDIDGHNTGVKHKELHKDQQDIAKGLQDLRKRDEALIKRDEVLKKEFEDILSNPLPGGPAGGPEPAPSDDDIPPHEPPHEHAPPKAPDSDDWTGFLKVSAIIACLAAVYAWLRRKSTPPKVD